MPRAHLGPIAAEPVSESLNLLIATDEMERDMARAPITAPLAASPTRVLNFAAAPTRRKTDARAKAAKATNSSAPGGPSR